MIFFNCKNVNLYVGGGQNFTVSICNSEYNSFGKGHSVSRQGEFLFSGNPEQHVLPGLFFTCHKVTFSVTFLILLANYGSQSKSAAA